ncbi:hypothetical protein [Pseudoroseomonas ludipueritiae]|nr:hypothetical protein [Pseudoroseomonas ludipueritiae]
MRGLIDTLLNQEALDKFKKRYAWRHQLFRSAVRTAGLELATAA